MCQIFFILFFPAARDTESRGMQRHATEWTTGRKGCYDAKEYETMDKALQDDYQGSGAENQLLHAERDRRDQSPWLSGGCEVGNPSRRVRRGTQCGKK